MDVEGRKGADRGRTDRGRGGGGQTVVEEGNGQWRGDGS